MSEAHVYERAATRILSWLHVAEQDLLGCHVETFDGQTGIVRELRLDESHGLCFTCCPADKHPHIDGARIWRPVSSIKAHGALVP